MAGWRGQQGQAASRAAAGRVLRRLARLLSPAPAPPPLQVYLLALSRGKERTETQADIMDTLFLDFTRRGRFGLERARAAVHLERKVDADPMVGLCHRGASQLQPVPDYVCRLLECLWVEDLQLNIDMWSYPLRVLPGPSEFRAGQCSVPHGGQRPVPEGARPHVSFVLTMHNSVGVTAQCLLELFRTAHEVPSAEYIIVDDGTSEDTGPLMQVGAQVAAALGRRPRPAALRCVAAGACLNAPLAAQQLPPLPTTSTTSRAGLLFCSPSRPPLDSCSPHLPQGLPVSPAALAPCHLVACRRCSG